MVFCINQADGKEKTNQVQLMRKVYSKSKHVLVWLGEVPDAILEHSVKPPISSAGSQQSGHTTPVSTISTACAMIVTKIAKGEHLTTIEPFNGDNEDVFFRRVDQAFMFLCDNTWFTRRWFI